MDEGEAGRQSGLGTKDGIMAVVVGRKVGTGRKDVPEPVACYVAANENENSPPWISSSGLCRRIGTTCGHKFTSLPFLP